MSDWRRSMHRRASLRLACWAALAAACTGSINGGTDEDRRGADPVGGATGGHRAGGATVSTGGEAGAGGAGTPFVAARGGIRRLTRAELDATLRDLLGDATAPASRLLPEESIDKHFAFDDDYAADYAVDGGPSLGWVEAFEALVDDVVDRLAGDGARLGKLRPCAPSGPADRACFDAVVARFGRRVLRRPLTDAERTRYGALIAFGADAGSFDAAVTAAVRALLFNPLFAMRLELGRPVDGTPGLFRLDGYELASRLSFTLLGTTPDEALLDAAAMNRLEDPAGLRAVADALIADPRAREHVHHFVAHWLGYARTLPPAVAPALRRETDALVDDVIFDRRAGLAALFTSDRTYLDDALRAHYTDLALPAAGKAAWVPYPTGSPRAGVLSHGSVLSAFRSGDETSLTKRGFFVRERLLCEPVPEPPGNVNVDAAAAATQCRTGPKSFIETAHQETSCKVCHVRLDPIGQGLERFDTLGRLRDHDDGKPECPIDASGKLLLDDGSTTRTIPFSGPAALGRAVVESGQLERCFVRQLYRFAVGREDDDDEQPRVDALTAELGARGGDVLALMVSYVTSPAFALRRAHAE